MTDQEIQELAHYCANEIYSHFGNPDVIIFMDREYEDVIRHILRTHDIKKRK